MKIIGGDEKKMDVNTCMVANRRDFLKGALCFGPVMVAANLRAQSSCLSDKEGRRLR